MARVRTQVMMSDTTNQISVTGDKVRADAWYAPTDGTHTVSVRVSAFHGRIGIQATLEPEPAEEDWFPIHLDGTSPMIEFPLQGDESTGTTGTFVWTFEGKFVWLRAVMDRDNIVPPPDASTISLYGNVVSILLAR